MSRMSHERVCYVVTDDKDLQTKMRQECIDAKMHPVVLTLLNCYGSQGLALLNQYVQRIQTSLVPEVTHPQDKQVTIVE